MTRWNSPAVMANIVFDASSMVGALWLAGAREVICLSDAMEAEIREVFSRPKFARDLGHYFLHIGWFVIGT